MNQNLVSFVVRFVREVDEDQQARWRGIIKHVQGDAKTHFSQFSEALAFMQAHVDEVVRGSLASAKEADAATGEANLFLETARLWGAFWPPNIREMLEASEEAMRASLPEQSASVRVWDQAISATLTAWDAPIQAEQEQTMSTLAAMADELTALNAKLDELETRLRGAEGNRRK